METIGQMRAAVPLGLKRRTMSALKLQGRFFNQWLEEQMQRWLEEMELEEQQRERDDVEKGGTP